MGSAYDYLLNFFSFPKGYFEAHSAEELKLTEKDRQYLIEKQASINHSGASAIEVTLEDIAKAKEAYLFDGNVLYIVCNNGKAYGFRKNSHFWFLKSNFEDYFDSELMLEYFLVLSNNEALQLYSKWTLIASSKENEINRIPLIEQDLMDLSFNVYKSPRRRIGFSLHDKRLELSCHDFGAECKMVSGTDEYEFYYNLDEDETRQFLECLRKDNGPEKEIMALIMGKFGIDNGPAVFEEYCKKNNIKPHFFSI